jgi:hypothetical protein
MKGKAMQYEVQVRCVIERTVICENCTEEQARENPFEFAVEESYGEVVDYEVKSVTESK